MRTAIILIVVGLMGLATMIGFTIAYKYQYNKNYKSLWELADRSSTIEQKSEYIDKFVNKLETSGFEGEYNAIFLKTPENSFDSNLGALKSLQQRLVEIKDMDPSSFEYQTAIQQITQQEQGEANDMMNVFEEVFVKENYFLLWKWVGAILATAFIVCVCVGAVMGCNEY